MCVTPTWPLSIFFKDGYGSLYLLLPGGQPPSPLAYRLYSFPVARLGEADVCLLCVPRPCGAEPGRGSREALVLEKQSLARHHSSLLTAKEFKLPKVGKAPLSLAAHANPCYGLCLVGWGCCSLSKGANGLSCLA